jgi:hypothetical protein
MTSPPTATIRTHRPRCGPDVDARPAHQAAAVNDMNPSLAALLAPRIVRTSRPPGLRSAPVSLSASTMCGQSRREARQ